MVRKHRLSLADAWAVRFEAMAPARRYRARKGQRHLPGLWWSSTMAGHVGYESWLEPDQLMWLDCDAVVLRLVRGPDRAWLDLRGLVCREIRRPEPASVNQ